MSVKIRLQRHGKKGKPFYWIVAADARAKRDGKLLEKLGTYNPNTNPATIDLDLDGTVTWLQNGAQPTDTARAILSYKGALLKNHLAGGVKKGALTEDQADEKFNAWLDAKEGKITSKVENLEKSLSEAKQKALEAEREANQARIDKAAAAPVEEAAATEEAASDVEATATDSEASTEEASANVEAAATGSEAPKEEATAKVEAAPTESEAPKEEATAKVEAATTESEAPKEEATAKVEAAATESEASKEEE